MPSASSIAESLLRSLASKGDEQEQDNNTSNGVTDKLPSGMKDKLPSGVKDKLSGRPGGLGLAAGAALGAAGGYAVKKLTERMPKGSGTVGEVKDKAKDKAETAKIVEEKVATVQEAMAGKKTGIGKAMAAAGALKNSEEGGGEPIPKLRDVIEEHIDVAVSRNVAYNQWTQFEDLPQIMKGVSNVSQSGDDNVAFSSRIGIWDRSWKGEIVEQQPDKRIAWKREQGGVDTWGVVTFHTLDENLTRVMVQMELHPEGFVEWCGQTLRIPRRRVRRDLKLFKNFIELRNAPTGQWRDDIDKDVQLHPNLTSIDDDRKQEQEQDQESEAKGS